MHIHHVRAPNPDALEAAKRELAEEPASCSKRTEARRRPSQAAGTLGPMSEPEPDERRTDSGIEVRPMYEPPIWRRTDSIPNATWGAPALPFT